MYDQLLGARGTAPHAEALQAPVLRLRLLRSLLYLVHIEAVRSRLKSPSAPTTLLPYSLPAFRLCLLTIGSRGHERPSVKTRGTLQGPLFGTTL